VNVDDVLQVFDTDTRAQLRELLSNLGNGLADHGAQLQEAFVSAMPLVEVAGKITKQLAAQPQLTKQLVHNANVLTADLGQRNQQLRTLVSYASQTLGTLQASSPNLAATLQDLPTTLNDVNTSFNATMGVLGKVNTAVTALDPVADNLSNGLSAVQDLSTSAKPAVNALQSPIKQLVPLANTLVPLSQNLEASVTRLSPQVPVLNRAVSDLAECRQGINGFFQWDASMTKFGDVHGKVPRGNLLVGATAAGLNSPYEAAEPQCISGAPIGDANPTMANAH
jgi:ABC-type transporter Mla subunit MlaD